MRGINCMSEVQGPGLRREYSLRGRLGGRHQRGGRIPPGKAVRPQGRAFLFKVKPNTWVNLSQTRFLRSWAARRIPFLSSLQSIMDLEGPKRAGLIHVFGC